MPKRWNTQDVSLLDKPTRNNNKTQFQHWKTVNSSCMSSPYHVCFYRKECHNLYQFTPFLHSKTKNNHLKIWHAWDESSCNQTTKGDTQKMNTGKECHFPTKSPSCAWLIATAESLITRLLKRLGGRFHKQSLQHTQLPSHWSSLKAVNWGYGHAPEGKSAGSTWEPLVLDDKL